MKNSKVTVFIVGLVIFCTSLNSVFACSGSGCSGGNDNKNDTNIPVSNTNLHRHNTTLVIIDGISRLLLNIAEAFSKIEWNKCTCCNHSRQQQVETKIEEELPSMLQPNEQQTTNGATHEANQSKLSNRIGSLPPVTKRNFLMDNLVNEE